METLDITSEGLRNQGYRLMKEGVTIALYHNGSCHRVGFYKNDWDKSIRKTEEQLSKAGIEQLIIQSVITSMSANYPKLMNGHTKDTIGGGAAAETETPTEKLVDITAEQWFKDSSIKYQNLKDTIQKSSQPLPQLWLPLEFALSIKNILNIEDCTLPFAGVLLGVPSSLKTVAVELFRRYWHGIYRDDFSPKGFVSHYSGLTEEQLQKNDLLPQIRYKFFLTPELAPLFTGNEDEIKKSFGNLTRILDGKGFQSHSGTQGGRGYHGEFMFTWLGAVVDVSPRVHRMMGNLGPKMYFLRLPKAFKKEGDIVEQLKHPQFAADLAKIERALFDYLKWFEASPLMDVGKTTSGLPKIVWDSEKNDMKALKYIAKLSLLIGPLRGVVEVGDTENTQGSGYGFSIPIVEEPDRAATQLYNLARGHALIHGRNYITLEDIPLLIKVVLSTAPIARVAVFEMLLAMGGTLKTSDIKEGLGISHHTVHKTMTELVLLGLVDGDKEGEFDNSEKVITLKKQFRWCLGSRFRQLREGFSPARKSSKRASSVKRSSNRGDNVDKDFTKLEEKSGFDIDVFWKTYDNLENQKQTEGPPEEGTVSESAFKHALISSGKFTAGEATQLVKEMIDQDKLTRLGFDVLEKNSQANISKSEGK